MTLAFTLSVLAPNAYAADLATLQAYGVDSIAGYSTLLSSTKTLPDTNIFFKVKKPDGTLLNIPAKTNSEGIAKIDLYDYHTRKAGRYEVGAYLQNNPVTGPLNHFTVYPDEVSISNSTLSTGRSVIKADGSDATVITVKIVDQYANPFKGHVIRLISSRSDDVIMVSSNAGLTNENGTVVFNVSSKEPGISVFSAVDTTSGSVLKGRLEIAFLNDSSYLNEAGGNLEFFIPVASALDAGPLNKFAITGLPETVQPNTDLSFSVAAQDQNGLTVQNYTGTVHFSVEGSNSLNVTLPEDYTFKADDLGVHEFSLGLRFVETGTYKIVVTDVSNTAIKGEINVAVGAADGDPSGSGSGIKPLIGSPVEGTYSQNVQNISGTAQSLSTVKIFDNDQEIGMVQTDSSGKFSFQTNPLEDGQHGIYAVWLDDSNEVKGTSDTIEIIIDTSAPVVEDIVIDPASGIKAGDVINVKIYTEKGLSDSAVIFNLDIYHFVILEDYIQFEKMKTYNIRNVICMDIKKEQKSTWLVVGDNLNLKLYCYKDKQWEKNYRILYHNDKQIK